MEIIERPEILSQVLAHIGKGLIIVLVGQRRVGKSYVLKMLRNKIASTPDNANIIYIDKEKREFGPLASIADNYPKYVISMTPLVSRSDYNGITHLHLRRFLMQGLG